MRILRFWKVSVIPLLFALALVACGSTAAAPTPVASVAATVVRPTAAPGADKAPADTLRWPVEGLSELTSLDPAKPGDAPNNTVINLIFAGLVRLNDRLEVVPDGASDWKVSTDGTIYTFSIREGLRFADGTPVMAEDFVYSFNRALSPGIAAFAASAHFGHIVGAQDVLDGKAKEIAGITAPDQRTLRIELDAPIAYFLSLLTYPDMFVVPKKLVASGGAWQEQAYGTGPFKVAEWKHGQSILLAANENYWQGQPGINKVMMPFIKDSETAYQLYQTGALDIIGTGQNPLPSAHVAEVQNLPDFKSVADLRTRYVGFNNLKPPFDNQDVRRAFAQAINKQTLAKQLLADTVIPADRILPTGLLGTQLSIRPQAFDPAAAKALLAKAGYPNGQGLPGLTLVYGEEGDNGLVAQALQSMWEGNLGVKISLQSFELATFSENLNTTYYTPTQGLQFYYSAWGADYPDPQNFLSVNLHSGNPNNNGHFSDPQFDRLTEEADRLGDRAQIERRLQLYNQAEQIAIDKVGWLPVLYPKINALLRPRVQGMAITPQGLIVNDWSKVALT